MVIAAMRGFRCAWRGNLGAILTVVTLAAILLARPGSAAAAGVKKIAVGNGFYLLLMTDGVVWGFGNCDRGELWPLAPAPCQEIRRPRPLTLPGTVTDIAAADGAAFVLLENGTVMSWGTDLEGQLGTGPRYEYGRNRPVRREPTAIPGLTGVVQIAAAGAVAAALTADGTAFWWGARPIDTPNRTASVAAPVPVDGMPAVSTIALSPTHLLGIARDDRAVYAVGQNTRGQLGVGNTTTSNRAVRVSALPPAVSVCASREYSAAVLADGTVREWGEKIGGVGPGTVAAEQDPDHGINTVPAPVPGVAGAERASCMSGVTGVVMKDRTLRLWGHDGWGQIGVGRAESEYQPRPKQPTLTDVADLFVGGSRTFAVTTDGRAFFWGVGNTSYAEPMKTMKQRPAPFPIGEPR